MIFQGIKIMQLMVTILLPILKMHLRNYHNFMLSLLSPRYGYKFVYRQLEGLQFTSGKYIKIQNLGIDVQALAFNII